MRTALNKQDTLHLRTLLCKGADVNTVLSDVFNDTPLLYAVKHGALEVVEALLESRQVDLGLRDRSNHTALDEAIRAWFVLPASEKRYNVGKRYRIIKCLLAVGASNISHNFIDLLVFSNGNTKAGCLLLSKLVKLFCQKGNGDAKGRLLCILVPYKFATNWVNTLLVSGADPCSVLLRGPAGLSLPLATAVLLTRACNKPALLARLDRDTGHGLQHLGDQWPLYQEVVRILTLSGHALQLSSMQYLYVNHAETYRWLVDYQTSPSPLKHLCRVAARKELNTNALWAVDKLKALPGPLKHFLIFQH